jgi:hypothetical protein
MLASPPPPGTPPELQAESRVAPATSRPSHVPVAATVLRRRILKLTPGGSAGSMASRLCSDLTPAEWLASAVPAGRDRSSLSCGAVEHCFRTY